MEIIETGEATGIIPVEGFTPIKVIGTKSIRDGFDPTCLQQAVNSRRAPGVSALVLNPDAHAGYGAPVGCVLASEDNIYPGPIGVDIRCSMSLLQTDLPASELVEPRVRRALINAVCERVPTGAGKGQRTVPHGRSLPDELWRRAMCFGASSDEVLNALEIPLEWRDRCEDVHNPLARGMDSVNELADEMGTFRFSDKFCQLGSYGGGNHFGECCSVEVQDHAVADVFGLQDGKIAFLSHCGSRGMGFSLAQRQFKKLQKHFEQWNIPFPGKDRELVCAPIDSPEGASYLEDMWMGGNFAILNHLTINSLIGDAFRKVFPGCQTNLVYYISHNFARREILPGNKINYVHRKGATRAYPAGHFSLADTPFFGTGHPILLPGNARDGSVVMVASEGAANNLYSVNHGAGRCMGRKQAERTLRPKDVEYQMNKADVLSNCRVFPIDEAPDAYKNFDEVLRSVELADLARPVARLRPRFVVKDGDTSLRGAA